MLKIGIIGVGGISMVHIAGIKKSNDAQITAICDIDEEKLQKIGDELDIKPEFRFTDYNDLINCDEVQAVEICTPNYLHIEMAKAVIKAGKPVEVEKPLGASYDGTDELLEELKKNKVPNMMCFSYRFMSAVRFAKYIIEQGHLGEIINVNVEYLKSSAFMKGRRLEWRFIKEYSGSGVLCDLGVHLIDMTRFLIGEFKSVFAFTKIVVDKRKKLDSEEYAPVETDDLTSFIAKMDNGAIMNFMVTRCAWGHHNTIKYEIYGTKGVISFNLNNPDEINICIGEIDTLTGGMHTVKVPTEFKLSQEQAFIDAAIGKSSEYAPGISEGAKCQIVVDALLKSAEENRRIDL